MGTKLEIDPPLLNSSSPWATTFEDLKALYTSPYTGAVTTRTCLLSGFADKPDKHQHCFFEAGHSSKLGKSIVTSSTRRSSIDLPSCNQDDRESSSLNTYGYSPLPLDEYLNYIGQLVNVIHTPAAAATTSSTPDVSLVSSPINPTILPVSQLSKPIIISVTGTPNDIIESHRRIMAMAYRHPQLQLAMEINLSCPNIAGKPPPAYDPSGLEEYLAAVAMAKDQAVTLKSGTSIVFVGIKLPPYTYMGQFDMVVQCLRQIQMAPELGAASSSLSSSDHRQAKVIDFITSTNTLGSSLVLLDSPNYQPALASEAGTGIGGMAGAAIHGLSLGNVATLRRLLNEFDETRETMIIGVGGVSDKTSFKSMRSVGADAVGVATALGKQGVGVFESIAKG